MGAVLNILSKKYPINKPTIMLDGNIHPIDV